MKQATKKSIFTAHGSKKYQCSAGNWHCQAICPLELIWYLFSRSLICGWQTPKLNSVTDSLGQYQQYCLAFCSKYQLHRWNSSFWVLHKGCQNINLNSIIADCIVNVWLIWFARDVFEHLTLFKNLAGPTKPMPVIYRHDFLWSMNALYLHHHGYSCKYSHRSSSRIISNWKLKKYIKKYATVLTRSVFQAWNQIMW